MHMEATNQIFVDSNFFVALFNSNDSQYAKALKLSKHLDEKGLLFTISNYIFLEIVTVLSQKRGKEVGNAVGEYLLTSSNIAIVHIDEKLNQETWDIFRTIKNKDISFVDCSTTAVMKAEGIAKLLTFDQDHFKKLKKIFRFGFVEI